MAFILYFCVFSRYSLSVIKGQLHEKAGIMLYKTYDVIMVHGIERNGTVMVKSIFGRRFPVDLLHGTDGISPAQDRNFLFLPGNGDGSVPDDVDGVDQFPFFLDDP